MDFVTKLRNEFAALQSEADAVITAAETDARELTADEKAANDKRFARMQTINATLAEKARFAKLAFDAGTVELPAAPKGKAEFEASEGEQKFAAKDIDRDKLNAAVSVWAASGDMARQFATITTSTQSGIFLPKQVVTPNVPSSANVFREAFTITGQRVMQTPSTAVINVPVLDAAAGGQVAENASSETENTPGLTESIILTPKTYQSGAVWFSNQQLQAVDYDLLGETVPAMEYSKELGLEDTIADAIVADAGITQVVTTSSTTGFTYSNLVDLNRKLPKRYDRSKVIILSAEAYSAAEKLVGDDGHPVLNRDPQNQELLRFNGTPVLRSDYMEAFGAGKVVGIVVSMLGFKLRDCASPGISRYTLPSKPNQTGLNLFSYHAYGYSVSAIAKLKTPAS